MGNDDQHPVELIPDGEMMSRFMEFPSMYGGGPELVLNLIFPFAGGEPESLVWRKYAPQAADVHALGCQTQALKRSRRPEAKEPVRYKGFTSCLADTIRAYRSPVGHGFHLAHEPSEGRHHVHVMLPIGDDGRTLQLTKTHKTDMKVALGRLFKEFQQHRCEEE